MEVEGKAKGEKRAIDQSKAACRTKGCVICLKAGHWWVTCPYRDKYPPGARVGSHVEIICFCCGEEDAHPGKPSVNWRARCELKDAFYRPSFEEELKIQKITSPLEDDATDDGTRQRKRIRENEQGGEVFESTDTDDDMFIEELITMF